MSLISGLRLPSATDFLTIAEESQQRTLGKTELDPSNSVLPGLPHRVIPNLLVNLLLEIEEKLSLKAIVENTNNGTGDWLLGLERRG